MGTRHLTMVRLHGELKVAQYGQWDGYPEGQGNEIAVWLRALLKKDGLENFTHRVDCLRWLPDREIKRMENAAGAEWAKKHPELTRDTGSKILGLIEKGKVKAVVDRSAFLKDGVFCEWAYEIDLTTQTVVVYKGFFKKPGGKKDEYETRKWRVLTFAEFTKPGAMKKLREAADEEYERAHAKP